MLHRRIKSVLTLFAAAVMTASAATNAACVVVHGRRHGRHRRHIRGRRPRHHKKRQRGHRKRRHYSSARTHRGSGRFFGAAQRKFRRFVEYGKATWYGGRFHGRKTASGERFDEDALTAAHKTLPFDTVVRVTRLDTGRSVTVRINDRGPYGKGRIVDLSKAAAARIGSLKRGVVRVKLTVVRWGKGRYKRTRRAVLSRPKDRSNRRCPHATASNHPSKFAAGGTRNRSALMQGGFGRTTRAP